DREVRARVDHEERAAEDQADQGNAKRRPGALVGGPLPLLQSLRLLRMLREGLEAARCDPENRIANDEPATLEAAKHVVVESVDEVAVGEMEQRQPLLLGAALPDASIGRLRLHPDALDQLIVALDAGIAVELRAELVELRTPAAFPLQCRFPSLFD